MIELDDLCVRRGPRIILRDSSLSFLGGIVGLIAPNGSGKTTLLETLAVPWDRRVSGRLLVDGVATTPGEWERYCFYLPSAAKLLEPPAHRARARADCETPVALRRLNREDRACVRGIGHHRHPHAQVLRRHAPAHSLDGCHVYRRTPAFARRAAKRPGPDEQGAGNASARKVGGDGADRRHVNT